MNKTVTASGMQVKAQAEGSLVITAGTLPADGLKTTDYNFSETTSTALYASTHDSDYTTYSTGLKRVKNAENINLETGAKKNSEATLEYEVASNGDVNYYKDYIVYIAGDGQSFTNQTLTISLTGVITGDKTINKAVSVDFYGMNVSGTLDAIVAKDNYLGTLNVAGTRNKDSNTIETYNEFTTKAIATIPQANGNAAYGVVMRVYYDGALLETGNATNDCTVYKAAEGDAVAGTYYYTDNKGTSVATVKTGDSVTKYFVVDTDASIKTYAKTVEVADLNNVTLTAKFVANAA